MHPHALVRRCMRHGRAYTHKLTIMKLSIMAVIAIAFITYTTACQRKAAAQSTGNSTSNTSPTMANLEYKDANGNLNLLGATSRDRLAQAPFDTWYNKSYADYSIDSATANKLKPLLKNKQFVIFMGTWCGDSRREVPRMYKLLDYCGVKPSQIKLVNVNNHDSAYKQSPAHEERGLYIFRVPDLLVFDRDKEVGRIVESPLTTLEKDLLAIAEGKNYSPKYPGTAYLINQFQTPGWMSTPAAHEQVAEQLRPLIGQWGELASFGRVMLIAGETDRAIDAMRINTILYPAEAGAWQYLATAYVKKANKPAAKDCCQKVLQLQPGNQQAIALLDQLNRE